MNSCFLPRLPSTKKWLPAETVRVILLPAETLDSRQEAESHGQSLQEAIYQAQQSLQEARDRGQSRRKPNMTGSLCRKRKLADSFIPCDNGPQLAALNPQARKIGRGSLMKEKKHRWIPMVLISDLIGSTKTNN